MSIVHIFVSEQRRIASDWTFCIILRSKLPTSFSDAAIYSLPRPPSLPTAPFAFQTQFDIIVSLSLSLLGSAIGNCLITVIFDHLELWKVFASSERLPTRRM